MPGAWISCARPSLQVVVSAFLPCIGREGLFQQAPLLLIFLALARAVTKVHQFSNNFSAPISAVWTAIESWKSLLFLFDLLQHLRCWHNLGVHGCKQVNWVNLETFPPGPKKWCFPRLLDFSTCRTLPCLLFGDSTWLLPLLFLDQSYLTNECFQRLLNKQSFSFWKK